MTFLEEVFQVVQRVPAGSVTTYAAVARAIGRPRAVRAVGNALNANTDTEVTPCHRVIRSDGRLGGYNGGAAAKKRKLELEGVQIQGDLVLTQPVERLA